jgi:hypothetical protein
MEWTDERMDDLASRMGAGFEQVDGDIRDLSVEMRDEFKAVRSEMRDEFKAVRGEINDVRIGMDAGFTEIRAEMQAGFGLVHTEMAAMHAGMAELRGMIFRVILTTLAGAFALSATLMVAIVSGALS